MQNAFSIQDLSKKNRRSQKNSAVEDIQQALDVGQLVCVQMAKQMTSLNAVARRRLHADASLDFADTRREREDGDTRREREDGEEHELILQAVLRGLRTKSAYLSRVASPASLEPFLLAVFRPF